MNPVFKKIFWSDQDQKRSIPKSLSCAVLNSDLSFDPCKMQEHHRLTLNFNIDFWINDDNQKQRQKDIFLDTFIKQLHHHFYGNIEVLLNELTLHVMREEYQDCIDTINLLRQAIKGD